MKVLLFGGTSEGRILGLALRDMGIVLTVCVATAYGGELLPGDMDVRVGRLDENAMAAQMAGNGYTCVVDATHPYAAVVTKNIHTAAMRAGMPYYRLVRDGDVEGDWLQAENMADAAQLAQGLSGGILLTTGSKELNAFALPGLTERCYPRVLSNLDSLSRCLQLGFPAAQIICMQGPFSKELNTALLKQFDIKVLVTKATGGAGGFWEKVEAAREADCAIIVVDRPLKEQGYTTNELIVRLREEAFG